MEGSKLKVKPSLQHTFSAMGSIAQGSKLQSSIASFQSKLCPRRSSCLPAVHATGHLDYVHSTNGLPAALLSAIICFLPPLKYSFEHVFQPQTSFIATLRRERHYLPHPPPPHMALGSPSFFIPRMLAPPPPALRLMPCRSLYVVLRWPC